MPVPAALERLITTVDEEETRQLGARLAQRARPGDLLALYGDLGVGKTQLAKGFGRGLGVAATINSPSFVLMAEYLGRLPFFHIDLYRLADAADALAGGVLDERQAAGVALVEWADRLAGALPEERLDVVFEGAGDDPRRISLRAIGGDYARYLEVAG
ncbi:MAG TPA: tRNA (adenosine(37)-N6)-threonylcarbamoyltransferase complex ATPase subunit type 1 TsaE [Candidatus Limnocylindrales bacterium]